MSEKHAPSHHRTITFVLHNIRPGRLGELTGVCSTSYHIIFIKHQVRIAIISINTLQASEVMMSLTFRPTRVTKNRVSVAENQQICWISKSHLRSVKWRGVWVWYLAGKLQICWVRKSALQLSQREVYMWCTGMVSSRRIANLLGKQISLLDVTSRSVRVWYQAGKVTWQAIESLTVVSVQSIILLSNI